MKKKLLAAGLVFAAITMQACSKKENQNKANVKTVTGNSVSMDLSSNGNEIVAMVEGSAIKRSVLDEETKYLQQLLMMRGETPHKLQFPELQKEALDNLIGKNLLNATCQKKGIKASTQEIKEKVDLIRKKFKNEADFEKVLGTRNLSIAILKEQISQGIAIRKLIEQEIAKDVKVSPEEAQDFYKEHPDDFKQQEQLRARHILIKVDEQAGSDQKEKARKKVEGIKKELKAGKDFATLAKKYSQGPSGARGGDLGYFGKGQMVKPFEKVAFALKPGQVSDIVETKFGYHLIKVEDKKAESLMAFEKIKDRLTSMLKQKKIQEKVKQYVDELRKDAKIEILLKS